MDLGFRVVEERIRALNWLGLNEGFFSKLNGYMTWKVCGFMVLIGKRKAVI